MKAVTGGRSSARARTAARTTRQGEASPASRRAPLLAMLALALLAAVPTGAGAQEPEVYRLTLGDAVRLAADRAAPVLEARARADGADARARGATAELLPSLSAGLSWGARTFNTASFGLEFPTPPGQEPLFDPAGEVVGPVHGADVRVRLEVPLLDPGALGRRRSARAAATAVRSEVGAVSAAAAHRAGRAYLESLRARAEVAAREADLELALELVRIAETQVDAGTAVAIDVTRAEAQVATVRAQLLTARHRSALSDLALRRALRLPEGAGLELVESLDEPMHGEAPPEEEATEAALARRPELVALRGHRAAASEALSAVHADRLPRLALSFDDGAYGGRFSHLLHTYTWNLSVEVPVFDGFERSAEAQQERARIHELDYRLAEVREDVVYEVREALQTLGAVDEQVAAAEEWLRLAEMELAQEQERVAAGVAGTADVVEAALRLNDARTARLDALLAAREARLDLAAVTGRVVELP